MLIWLGWQVARRRAQAFTFAAYGQLLALHDTAGAALPATATLTSLGYLFPAELWS